MSGASYGRTARAEEIGNIREKDPRDMTREEAVIEIGRLVGYNNSSTEHVGKKCLWSCYWALTGETYCPRQWLGTSQSPHTGNLRFAVARNAGFFYSTENKKPRQENPGDVPAPKGFRKNQVRALVNALRESPDRRRHGPESQ